MPVRTAKPSVLVGRLALLLLALVALVAMDLAFDGPYVTWFNRRHESLATASGLIGKHEEEIVKLFGVPSRVDDTPRAYVYYPYPFVPVSQVKVLVESGKVTGLKVLDD